LLLFSSLAHCFGSQLEINLSIPNIEKLF